MNSHVHSKPERKSLVLPIIGAVVFFLPGAVMWSFAQGEAMSFSSDWVYLSTPLLLLSGLCFVTFFHRILDAADLIVGAVAVAGGMAYAIMGLSASIQERKEWLAEYQALQYTEEFCRGAGKSNPLAAAYDPKKPGVYNTIVFEPQSTFSKSWKRSYAKELSGWESNRLGTTALVACITEVPTAVETCQYDSDATMERIQLAHEVKLYAVKTGELVFQSELKGEMPRV